MNDSTRQDGWTGGQYSLVRAGAGLALAVRFALHARGAEPLEAALHASGALWSLGFALGWRERACAFALAPTLIAAGFVGGERGPGQVHWLALAVLLHLATPPAPFGSLDARGRVDPGGGWRMPRALRWFALAGLVGTLATAWLSRSTPWLAGSWYAALCLDPAWIPPRAAAQVERLFYDGSCGLCQRSVRFVLAESRDGARWRFAPLQGETFERSVERARRASLPDSVVVLTADGQVLTRSRAVRHVAASLGGAWRALAAAASVVPGAVLDLGYNLVARVRTRLFAAPTETCPLLPPELRARFDP